MCFLTTMQVYRSAAEERQEWMLCRALQARLVRTLPFYIYIWSGKLARGANITNCMHMLKLHGWPFCVWTVGTLCLIVRLIL